MYTQFIVTTIVLFFNEDLSMFEIRDVKRRYETEIDKEIKIRVERDIE